MTKELLRISSLDTWKRVVSRLSRLLGMDAEQGLVREATGLARPGSGPLQGEPGDRELFGTLNSTEMLNPYPFPFNTPGWVPEDGPN